MRNIKLTLEYDGSKFFGFQRQPNHLSVQESLESALSKFFNQPMKIAAASGRTDTGVHAEAQIVNFKTASDKSVAQIQKALNALLPESVAVKKVQQVSDDFHARYSAKSKTYEYCVWNAAVRSPLFGTRAWHIYDPLDIKIMRQAARILIGRHDFRAFCAANGSAKTSVRTIKKFLIKSQNHRIVFTLEADGFLYHMVRNIVGTVVELGQGQLKLKDIKAILQSKDRAKAGRTAPARGLTLVRVTY
jgi:tRNA pseudouridine38-40 synthase